MKRVVFGRGANDKQNKPLEATVATAKIDSQESLVIQTVRGTEPHH